MLTYKFGNLMQKNIGSHGLPDDFFENNRELLAEIHQKINEGFNKGDFGFMKLPFEQPELDRIKKIAVDIRQKFKSVIVLGIGGSCLGALALHQAFNHPFHNQFSSPQIYFLDNVDPELIQALLDVIEIKKTLILVISKSGKTAETLSQFLLFFEKIKRAGSPKEQIIIITDPQKGPLREIAQEEEFVSFSIPPEVGGRYSVLTPVGLLPAAILKIDINALLKGAQTMAKRCQEIKNPAYLYALTHFLLLQQGYNIHVLFPYVYALRGLADWWRQLWAESLGKEGKGPTPVKALGVTDQHSQLQLYMEGPLDKVITFVTVKRFRSRLDIPIHFAPFADIAYLGGHTFNELIYTEQTATEAALTKAKRPNAKLEMDVVSPFELGEFFYCLELATVCCGLMMRINPLNQPGVELGKRYTQALMGREEYQNERLELTDWFFNLSQDEV